MLAIFPFVCLWAAFGLWNYAAITFVIGMLIEWLASKAPPPGGDDDDI